VEEWAIQEDGSTGIKKLGCERANGRLLRKREIRIYFLGRKRKREYRILGPT
jgi:hypothetical protein